MDGTCSQKKESVILYLQGGVRSKVQNPHRTSGSLVSLRVLYGEATELHSLQFLSLSLSHTQEYKCERRQEICKYRGKVGRDVPGAREHISCPRCFYLMGSQAPLLSHRTGGRRIIETCRDNTDCSLSPESFSFQTPPLCVFPLKEARKESGSL